MSVFIEDENDHLEVLSRLLWTAVSTGGPLKWQSRGEVDVLLSAMLPSAPVAELYAQLCSLLSADEYARLLVVIGFTALLVDLEAEVWIFSARGKRQSLTIKAPLPVRVPAPVLASIPILEEQPMAAQTQAPPCGVSVFMDQQQPTSAFILEKRLRLSAPTNMTITAKSPPLSTKPPPVSSPVSSPPFSIRNLFAGTPWTCSLCTFVSPAQADECQLCFFPREKDAVGAIAVVAGAAVALANSSPSSSLRPTPPPHSRRAVEITAAAPVYASTTKTNSSKHKK